MSKKRLLLSGGTGKKGYSGFPVSQFIALTDCPASYAGAGTKFVTVKAGENGLEFTPLPPLAITDTFVVNSQAAMLALVAQRGDVAIRTDINQSFILSTDSPGTLADWLMLLVSPTHALAGALHTADTITNLNALLSDGDLITDKAGEISAIAAKGTPTTADLLLIEDTADANKKKKITISTLPAAAPAAHALAGALHTADTITNLNTLLSDGDLITTKASEILSLTFKTPATSADVLLIEDVADSGNKKAILISSLPAAAPAIHGLTDSGKHSAGTITNLNALLSDGDLITDKAGEISAIAAKGTPTTADLLLIEDTADANKKKKITISTLPAAAPAAHALAGALHTADTITNLNTLLSDGDLITTKAAEISALTNKATAAYADLILIEDSAAANAKKKLPVSALLEAVRSNFYPADALMSPIAGWAINAMAPVTPDATYPEILVRALYDSGEQGFGIQFYIPAGVTNLIIEIFGRPATAPGTNKTVIPKIYTRNMPLNSAQTAWTAAYTMTSLAIPTNAYWQNYTQTISLATLSLTADNMAMIEITRALGTLVGDFNLAGLKIYFS